MQTLHLRPSCNLQTLDLRPPCNMQTPHLRVSCNMQTLHLRPPCNMQTEPYQALHEGSLNGIIRVRGFNTCQPLSPRKATPYCEALIKRANPNPMYQRFRCNVHHLPPASRRHQERQARILKPSYNMQTQTLLHNTGTTAPMGPLPAGRRHQEKQPHFMRPT